MKLVVAVGATAECEVDSASGVDFVTEVVSKVVVVKFVDSMLGFGSNVELTLEQLPVLSVANSVLRLPLGECVILG